ncbi:MAG TPA: MotA/TolQ/ExbB proton channel family protein [Parachlamydiales bacterium]|nr:MotA/TolQ/ExbB proton channel family protein [Parachlamydiales bacterium]
MLLFAAGNPFISAYLQSDWFGKGIFWSLFILSGISWTLLAYKIWMASQVKRSSNLFASQFDESIDLLHLQFSPKKGVIRELPHPYFEIYKALKKNTLQIMDRNHYLAKEAFLSQADLDLISSNTYSMIAMQHKLLEKNLFILSTIVTLGPFLGLLGTVWGILLTFSHLQNAQASTSMLSGLSMALATTVVGLVVAIPALIGYNYLKNRGKEYRRDMEHFSDLLLTNIELQYRR